MAEQPADRPNDGPAPLQPLISVIIPAFNEAARLGDSMRSIDDYATRSGRRLEVVVVDDGSDDGTADLVRGFRPRSIAVRLLVNPANMGKGYSVRRGMLEAAGELLLMCDADLSAPIEELEKLLPVLPRPGQPGSDQTCDVAIGSRNMPDSLVRPRRRFKRRLMAATFHLIRRGLRLLADLGDTQCGFKCFTRQAARGAFPLQRTHGFAFDCEVLAIAKRLGYRIREVGIAWHEGPSSRFHPLRDSARMLLSMLAIRWRLRRIPRRP